ncbi:MAG: hypothetical protein HKO57_06000 [Akkermansiaceae bacterium]|nr:hypothetical protein [Akkermansiaceae bacterium]
MSDAEPIVCRPTKWFFWRALALFAMFAVFAVLFFKDWKTGYPGKNLVYFSYKAFEDAKAAFAERKKEGLTKTEWERFAAEQELPAPEEGMLPEEAVKAWPEELRNYDLYRPAFEAGGMEAAPPGWIDYSDKMGWDEKPPSKSYDPAKIRNQFIYGVVSGVAALLALIFLLRIMRREMKVDDGAFYSPDGKKVPFDAIRRIDKRKWDSKGLAYLYYEDPPGEKRRAKVDGMVYGQFREEDGAPAEKLFQRILQNFSGELVELEEVPEDPGPSAAEESSPE